MSSRLRGVLCALLFMACRRTRRSRGTGEGRRRQTADSLPGDPVQVDVP